jgi:predicted house-cleaning noncanonical NTP pyrophosphatase (MazG superfamily)
VRKGKLVRDKIPDIIRASGEEPDIVHVHGATYQGRLHEKLREEAAELSRAQGAEFVAELADVLEVVYALADAHGVTREQLHEARLRKLGERGGFAKGIVWRGNRRTAEREGE